MLDHGMAGLLEPHLGSLLTDSAVDKVAASICARSNPRYDIDWAAFNYLYYSANFLKAYLVAQAFRYLLPGRDLSILDLGCGGGASTAGFIAGLINVGMRVASVKAVDTNQPQLNVFSNVTLPWLRLAMPCGAIEIMHDDMIDYCNRQAEPPPDVAILSYSFRELEDENQSRLRAILNERFVSHRSTVLIIDSDPFGHGVCVQLIGPEQTFRVPYDNVLFNCSAIENIGLQARPKFSISRTAEIIVNQYIKCWKEHDISLLQNIFHRNCRYKINGERELIGIDEVRSYWEHNAKRQSNVQVEYDVLSEAPDRIIMEWQARFDRLDTKDRRTLKGTMILHLEGGIIVELREYYAQTRSPLV